MTPKRKSPGRGLIALAIKIAPSDRKIWFEAMAAELDYVPQANRAPFAAGCVVAACRERIISPNFLHGVARSLLIGGAMGWAALNIHFAGRMSASNVLGLQGLGYATALLFGLGAFATAKFGYRATISLTAPLMAVLTMIAAAIRFGSVSSPVADLYYALILEDLAVLMIAVLVAGAAARLVTVQRAPG